MFDQYRIYSNGDLVYTQNHQYYESFINYLSLTDSAKENSECYDTLSKTRKRKPNVPGVYVEFSGGQSTALSIIAHLKFKIPITKFMMLANLKWYPGFMGDLTIEIQTTFKNLVIACVDTPDIMSTIFENTPSLYPEATLIGGSPTGNSTMVTYGNVYNVGNQFVQINNATNNAVYYNNSSNEWITSSQTITASTSTLQTFQLYTAFYMLKMDVYNALEYNYLQVPLLFPIQTVSNVKFTSALGPGARTLQNTATLSHCDTVLVIFPKTLNDRTCFRNLDINIQLNINGKFYPRERYSTIDDPRFYI